MANQPKNYSTNPANAGKVITGARALVQVNGITVGLFESCSVSSNIGTEPIFLLGKYDAAEISITSADVVNVACSGFRVLGAGVNTLPAVPLVQDLMNFDPFTIVVVDRQSGEPLETISNCVPTSHNSTYNARATSKITVNYTGTIGVQEDQPGDSDPGSAQLP